ncbi:PREDICTED: lipid droplet-associated hydrolase isoform X2 [Chinchilla lanigera]|uniref:lipid droplet-associated hydrolase isoform X2 n=1 Tax=Chinchilla lanigera TaxID=34839 RepID=UPI0006969445|nr:PREDICTED: lipid droplet-associated hydrolase isoform X2 [Chinchilla lanigera]
MVSKIEEEISVREEFVLCGKVETQVIKCGPWTDLINDQNVNRPKALIFVIPDPNAQEIKDTYGLRGQIEHKIAFLRTHVPKDMKLIFIGHSLGCYIILQILKHAPELPVIHSFLLFPTIERIAETPNGRIVTPLVSWFRYAFYAITYSVLKPCPDIVKSWLISIVFQVINLKTEFPLTNVFQPFCLVNIVYLAAQEMRNIMKRDDEIIKEHLSKMTFYYGTIDRWCPTQYYEDIKKDFPEGDIRLCQKNIPHAFVLRFSQDLAEMIAAWVKDNLSKIEVMTKDTSPCSQDLCQ